MASSIYTILLLRSIELTIVFIPSSLKPKKNTIYLQTWHGTPIKRIVLDDHNISWFYKKWIHKVVASHVTYLLAPCNEEITDLLANAFSIAKNKMISLGYPRNDIFVEKKANPDEIKERIKPNLSKTNKKIILYAPTFRDDEVKHNFNINFDMMKKQLDDEIILLVRAHSSVEIQGILSDQEFIFDVTKYPDMQELLYIADILITDYSSSFFDYTLLCRPIIFYPYDLEKYTNEIRGFY